MKVLIKLLLIVGMWCGGCVGICNAVPTKMVAPDIKILEQMLKDLEVQRAQRTKDIEALFSKMNNVLGLLSRQSAQESLSAAAFDAAKKDLAVAFRDVLDYFSGRTQSKKFADAESLVEKIRWTVVSTPGAAR
jgi:hypothetical protein